MYNTEIPCNVVWSKVKHVGDDTNSNKMLISLKMNESSSEGTPISFIDKGYDPSDIRYTFLSLVVCKSHLNRA